VRLLYHAGLIALPLVAVPPVAAESPSFVRAAQDGFELLIRCRWLLDPNAPVAYTRGFVETWCGLPKQLSRSAIYELLRQGVIEKCDELANNYDHPTSLYLPGPGLHPLGGAPAVFSADPAPASPPR
jgi:hypothetical protein